MKKYLLSIMIVLIMLSVTFISGCADPQQSVPQSTDKSKWAMYIDKSDGIKISYPPDWSVVTSKTTPIKTNTSYVTMENIIHIYTPDTNGVIQINGLDYPKDLLSDVGISQQAYNVIVEAFGKGGEGVTNVKVGRDENPYMINGNHARHLTLSFTMENTLMISDIYIIRHKDVYYIVSYLMFDTIALKDKSTADEIIQTFKTVKWDE